MRYDLVRDLPSTPQSRWLRFRSEATQATPVVETIRPWAMVSMASSAARLDSNWDAVYRTATWAPQGHRFATGLTVRVTGDNASVAVVQKVVSRKPRPCDFHEFERDDRPEPSVIVTDVDEGTFQDASCLVNYAITHLSSTLNAPRIGSVRTNIEVHRTALPLDAILISLRGPLVAKA